MAELRWDPDALVKPSSAAAIARELGTTGPRRDRTTSSEAGLSKKAALTPEEQAADLAERQTPENLAALDRAIRDEKDPKARAILEEERTTLTGERKNGPAAQPKAAPADAMPWSKVKASEAFKALSGDEQEAARRQYFRDVVAPKVPTDDLAAARAQFDEETAPTLMQKAGKALNSLVAGGVKRAGEPAVEQPAGEPTESEIQAAQLPALGGAHVKRVGVPRENTGSVMDNFTPPPAAPLIDQRGAPVTADTAAAIQQASRGVLGVRRDELLARKDWVGNVARAGQNVDPASIKAQDDAAARIGARETGSVEPSSFDFDLRNRFKDSSPVVRGLAKARLGFSNQGAGMVEFFADTVGADGIAQVAASVRGDNQAKEQAIGAFSKAGERWIEGATTSIATQLPSLLAGVLTGAEAPVLASMFMQTFGEEYGNGRAKKLDGYDAAVRAALFGAAEVIGEKFGLGDRLAGLRAAAKGMAVDKLADHFGKSIVKEIPGEQLTTVMQFLTDKIPRIGLNPQAGMSEYLGQVADTLFQTILQTGAMGGAAGGVSKAARALGGGDAGEIARALQEGVDGTGFVPGSADAAARASLSPDNAQMRQTGPAPGAPDFQASAPPGVEVQPLGVAARAARAGIKVQTQASVDQMAAATPPAGAPSSEIPEGADSVLSGDAAKPAAPVVPPADTWVEPAPESTADKIVLQNRNRSDAAYIQQVAGIAANPDPGRLSFSRDFASGAPVVMIEHDADIPKERMGREERVISANGRKIAVQYAAVEAADLLPSNQADGSPNADYVDGVAGKIRVVAGNGRAAGIQAAYGKGTAQGYREGIGADEALHGVPAEAWNAMTSPVLVRIMPLEEVTANIGDESNQTGVADKSALEKAKDDARRLDLSALSFNDDGEISPETARQFVDAMPTAEQTALRNPDGTPTRQAQDRLMAAIFWQAYGSDELVRLFAQATDPESRTVMAGLAAAAPQMMKLADPQVAEAGLDIRQAVTDAAGAVINAKRAGVALGTFAKQRDMGMSQDAYSVLTMMVANIRSAKAIGEKLQNAATFAYAEATKSTDSLFGDVVPRASRDQVLEKVNADHVAASQTNLEQPARRQADDGNAGGGAQDANPPGNARPPQGGGPGGPGNREGEGGQVATPEPKPKTPPQGGVSVSGPLYASRTVTNAADIIAWAQSQGFGSTLKLEDLHVTIAYSTKPVDGAKVEATSEKLMAFGGKRSVEPLGDQGAVVLKFSSKDLQGRWQQYRDAGASWDYESYQPHITITYDGTGVDLSKVTPYKGPIKLGPEKQEPLNEDKADEYVETPAEASKKSEKMDTANADLDAGIKDLGELLGAKKEEAPATPAPAPAVAKKPAAKKAKGSTKIGEQPRTPEQIAAAEARARAEEERLRALWKPGMVTSLPVFSNIEGMGQRYTQMLPGVVESVDGDTANVRIYADPDYGYTSPRHALHKTLAVKVRLGDLHEFGLSDDLKMIAAAGKLETGDAALVAANKALAEAARNGKKPAAPVEKQEVPAAVKDRVKWALGQLRDVEFALAGVERARGRGHTLALEIEDQQAKVDKARKVLDEFRALAKGNSIDPEATITELGGEPDLARFDVTPVKAAPKPPAAKKPVTPQVASANQLKTFIGIAADSIEQLRKVDVERVLTSNPIHFQAAIAQHIREKRPDLAAEVDEVLAELANPPALELAGQTQEEGRAAAEAADAKAKEEARAKAAKDEAERQARIRAEIAARSEAAADTFQLGQSAEDNLSGQADIFGNPAPAAAPAPKALTIDDVPPAVLKRVTVTVEQLHGNEVKAVEVSAMEAIKDLDEEISAYQKLLDCVRGA